jgi:hypothetical protein
VGVVAHDYNSSVWEAENFKFEASLVYIVKQKWGPGDPSVILATWEAGIRKMEVCG